MLRLHDIVGRALTAGHDTVLVFTQYADTMSYMRDRLDAIWHGGAIGYSTTGGPIRDQSTGEWVILTKRQFLKWPSALKETKAPGVFELRVGPATARVTFDRAIPDRLAPDVHLLTRGSPLLQRLKHSGALVDDRRRVRADLQGKEFHGRYRESQSEGRPWGDPTDGVAEIAYDEVT